MSRIFLSRLFGTRARTVSPGRWLTISLILFVHSSLGAPGGLDPDFEAVAPNGWVGAMALQADGKILLGGDFTTIQGVDRKWLARLNPDGRLDFSFLAGMAGIDGGLVAMAVQPDGKILIGGTFTRVNGVSRARLARLNPDGSLDPSFLQNLYGPSSSVRGLALQSDGRIYIGGDFYSVNGVARTNLARLNADGSLDDSFGYVPPASSLINLPYYSSYLWKITLQPDSKPIAWRGVMTYYGDWHGNDYQLARFNPDSSLDVEFPLSQSGWYAYPSVGAIAVQQDGKILVGGHFDSPRTNIARFLPSGGLDYYFSPGINGLVSAIAQQPDGKLIVCGSFETVNGSPHTNIVRLNLDGSVDSAFQASLAGGAAAVIIPVPGSKVLLGGEFTSVNGDACLRLARLMATDIAPAVLKSPPSQTCEEGTTLHLAAAATGYPPPACQWYFNGRPLTGATFSNLILTNAQASDSGTYVAGFTNVVGSASTFPALVSVIPHVDWSPVPALLLTAETGSLLHLEYSDAPPAAPSWLPLDTVAPITLPQFWFDTAGVSSPQRFYRTWQGGTPAAAPSLELNLVPAIPLAGNTGTSIRVDFINVIGPTNAWQTIATVKLTNSMQLFFDVSSIAQPPRLYRLVPVP